MKTVYFPLASLHKESAFSNICIGLTNTQIYDLYPQGIWAT